MSKAKEMAEAKKVDWNARIALGAIVIVGLILVPLDYVSLSASTLRVVLLVFAAFCLGGGIMTRVVYWDMSRRLREQEGELRSEFAQERDVWGQKNKRVEKAVYLVSQAIGMLRADKRNGDKAIGQARELLEGAVRSFILSEPIPDEDSIRREMTQRLEMANCPVIMSQRIVEGAMDSTPLAQTAISKLQAWGKFLRKDPMNGSQSIEACYCERAVTVGLPVA